MTSISHPAFLTDPVGKVHHGRVPLTPPSRALARATAQGMTAQGMTAQGMTAQGWTRTPWVGWDVDSCRPGQRCLQELSPLL